MNFNKLSWYFTMCLAGVVLFSCTKKELITDSDASLAFSTDTVYFDTVLVNVGSVTQRFKIYNPYDQPLLVNDIFLGNGSQSFYRLNIDGTVTNHLSNVTLRAKDSIYVFVEVTIDPQNTGNPVIITDSVVTIINGNMQSVKLFAYGQDVVLYKNKLIKTETWNNEKPYLIVGGVEVDSNELLTLLPGTRIYFDSRSSLLVRGKLDARGTYESPILLTGARFDGYFENASGQWGALFFHPNSFGNYLEYVNIYNATAGLQIGYPGYDHVPDVEIRNCQIINSQIMGIYAFNAKINAYNTIVADAGESLMKLFMGGDYLFIHCSFSNISARLPNYLATGGYKGRSGYSLEFSNYFRWYEYDEDYWLDSITLKYPMNLNFYNSIFYGVKKEEIKAYEKSGVTMNYSFHNCLITNHKDSLDYADSLKFDAIILNEDPLYLNDSVSMAPLNFELDSLSPCIDAGLIKWNTNYPFLRYDYKGNDRTSDEKPDMGAYEHEK